MKCGMCGGELKLLNEKKGLWRCSETKIVWERFVSKAGLVGWNKA